MNLQSTINLYDRKIILMVSILKTFETVCPDAVKEEKGLAKETPQCSLWNQNYVPIQNEN